MTVLMLALVVGAQVLPALPADVQEWFEAGQYQQVVAAAPRMPQPEAQYLVALSYQRLGQLDDARRVLSELADRGDTDPWSWIARSTRALVTAAGATSDTATLDAAQSDIQQALGLLTPRDAATTPAGPALAFANYQAGQILTYRRDYASAAEAFERSIDAMPSFAYAHYYAGMSYREITRIDQMANRFDQFLELAPDAPERARVRAMMRTVVGR